MSNYLFIESIKECAWPKENGYTQTWFEGSPYPKSVSILVENRKRPEHYDKRPLYYPIEELYMAEFLKKHGVKKAKDLMWAKVRRLDNGRCEFILPLQFHKARTIKKRLLED